MRVRRLLGRASAFLVPLGALAATGLAAADPGPTNLQETWPLVWVMIAISAAGAVLTWGIMAYALWKFRDPATRRRRYG